MATAQAQGRHRQGRQDHAAPPQPRRQHLERGVVDLGGGKRLDTTRGMTLPFTLGHEAAGVVEETGPGVTDLKRGDAVALVFVPSCGHCLPCLEGRPALCEPGAVATTAGYYLI